MQASSMARTLATMPEPYAIDQQSLRRLTDYAITWRDGLCVGLAPVVRLDQQLRWRPLAPVLRLPPGVERYNTL